MDWDQSDVEPAQATPANPKRPPPVPIRARGGSTRGKLPGVKEEYENQVWTVTNRITGQVFPNVPGNTPIDAKRHVLSANPSLKGMFLSTNPAHLTDLVVTASSPEHGMQDFPSPAPAGSAPAVFQSKGRGRRWTANPELDTTPFARGTGRNGTEVTGQPDAIDTANVRAGRPKPTPRPPDDDDDIAEPPTYVDDDPRREEGATAGGSLIGFQMPHPEANEDELSERVFRTMLEIVRKKRGGGGYVLYAPNQGKKKKPRKLGEFPTRAAAKAAELARNPPKDTDELKRARKRVDKLRKDPKARARAEKGDLSGRKKPRKSGAPARDRRKAKREAMDALTRGILETLFHDEELPGSPWDERISGMHPDHVASDRKLAAHHRNMEKASIASLGAARRALSGILRGMATVHPGDVSRDVDRGHVTLPITLDVGGVQVGPVGLYVDGGHVRIEMDDGSRRQLNELDPEVARKLRDSLMAYERDLPRITLARKAWAARDRHMDDMHAKLRKRLDGMSDVEQHLARQLLSDDPEE